MLTARLRTRNRDLTWAGLLFGVMLTGLVACAGPGKPAPLGRPLMLSPGEQLELPDASVLLYLGVSNDSRCLPGAQCVRAGDADVAIAITAPDAPMHSTSINTANPEVEIGKWRLRLRSLDAGSQPRLTLQIDERQP